MNQVLALLLDKLDEPTAALFIELDALVHESVTECVNEKIWQNAALYYVEGGMDFKPFSNCKHNKAVHIAPFKGYVNILADAAAKYLDELKEYKITPKAGLLQIYCGQPILKDVLKKIFKESLIG